MQRRGISEAVSVVMLLAVIATVSYFALNGSIEKTSELESSVADSIKLKGAQMQELLSVISVEKTMSSTSLELINYGPKDITIESVFVDGDLSPFTLLDSDENIFLNNTMPQREIMLLQVSYTGQSVQILTDSKNLFRFTV